MEVFYMKLNYDKVSDSLTVFIITLSLYSWAQKKQVENLSIYFSNSLFTASTINPFTELLFAFILSFVPFGNLTRILS